MSISTKVGKIIMAKHMILACIILSMLFITVAGNDDQTYFHELKAMQRTLKANRFQRQLLEKRYSDDGRKENRIMHATNHAEDQTEFQRQKYIDNIVSTNNVEKGHMEKVDTIRAKFPLMRPKVENVTTHTANQINKREHVDSTGINMSDIEDSYCHVKDYCEDELTVPDPCSSIISRAGWRARNATNVSYMNTPVSNIFIYQTAMYSCSTPQNCEYAATKLQERHMDEDGLDDIGYSFLVGDDGNAYEAGGWDRVGAHTRRLISNSVSIAVMGFYDEYLPYDPALKAINRLISCGIYKDKIMPNYKLYGYRDPASKFESTGHKLYDLIKTWSHFATLSSCPV